ncbi:helix-turn-helix domain-containing protein [Peribacillus loiseleuriae]|uniref:helix-turn-helix domain-containing protein n=1 Tax=Peribacillus loiseleuriae TaxID=1679170 RepID=UPI00382347BC
MGKGIQIANTHGWTVERLQAYEKTIQKASMARRIATIRLLMQGYYAIQVVELLNLHRETVSEYVKKFNTGGMEGLLHREYAPGRRAYLSPEEEQEYAEYWNSVHLPKKDTAVNRTGIPAF